MPEGICAQALEIMYSSYNRSIAYKDMLAQVLLSSFIVQSPHGFDKVIAAV